jgi:hypothetical protein
VKTGIQTCPCENREPVEKTWIPRIKCEAGSASARMTNLKTTNLNFKNLITFGKSEENRQFSPIIGLIWTALIFCRS